VDGRGRWWAAPALLLVVARALLVVVARAPELG
jgi:hypothetical protein